jgi:hypothetical protein
VASAKPFIYFLPKLPEANAGEGFSFASEFFPEFIWLKSP